MNRALIILALGFYNPISIAAEPRSLETLLPQTQVIGDCTLSFFFWKIYKATYLASIKTEKPSNPTPPFALRLEYFRQLKGEKIAKKTIEEMKRQAPISPEQETTWLEQMKKIFPNTKKGTILTGVSTGTAAVFFIQENGSDQFIGQIESKVFAKRFFDIWLGPKTSRPRLRRQLLGLKPKR